MFLLCFDVICPCFRKRRNDGSEDPVLRSAGNSWNSSEMGSSSDRMHGIALTVPPSQSPSRFSLSVSPQSSRHDPIRLNLSQVLKLTNNFSPALLIGEGFFGKVYKAESPDGRILDVKRASRQEATATIEFGNEAALLTQIEHRNLVQLLGYIDEGNERIIITECVPNGNLREHLDGKHGTILNFSQRLEIAIDVAHGLTYLHLYAEKPIIHRDVKASNILLTEGFRAKVADFGFARIGPTDPDQSRIETDVRGTAGYVDPEYLRSNQLTLKSDVFSYGILLLEILSARRPIELDRSGSERVTVRWAFNKYNKGRVREVLDPKLHEAVPEDVLLRIFELAFQCVAPTRADRPVMKEVVEQLWKIRRDYADSPRIRGRDYAETQSKA